MIYKYKDISINYELLGEGNTHLVFLHGWGGSTESFKFITNYLQMPCTCLFIDFPPFGKSDEPIEAFSIFDYAQMTQEIIENCGLKNVILVGHSFGGRIALILAGNDKAKKVVLIDGAGLKPRRGLIYFIKIRYYKLCKKFNIKKNMGSKDYRALSPVMKATFVNIVNTHLQDYAKQINVPTLIFWGKQDKDTPPYMAKKLHKLIKNSHLVMCENAGHFSYLDAFEKFITAFNYFLLT